MKLVYRIFGTLLFFVSVPASVGCDSGSSSGRGDVSEDADGENSGGDGQSSGDVSGDGANEADVTYTSDGRIVRDNCEDAGFRVSVKVDPTVLPGEKATFEVISEGALEPKVVTFEGGIAPDGSVPGWVKPPEALGEGRYEVAISAAMALEWTVTVDDGCAIDSAKFEVKADYPRVSFAHLAPGGPPTSFGMDAGITRWDLSVIRLDEADAVVLDEVETLRFGEVSASFLWQERTASFGAYLDGVEGVVSVGEPVALEPGRTYLFVLRQGAEGYELSVVAEPKRGPEREAIESAMVIYNGVGWADLLSLSAEGDGLAKDIASGSASDAFVFDWDIPTTTLRTGASGLDFEAIMDEGLAFPASPNHGVAISTKDFVKSGEAVTLLAHVGEDGGIALLAVRRDDAGMAFPIELPVLSRLPRVDQPAVALYNGLGADASVRDSLGRPVLGAVESEAVSEAFLGLGVDAESWALEVGAEGEVESAVIEDALRREGRARNLLCAWPGTSQVDMRVFEVTGAGGPEDAGDLDWVVASSLGEEVRVTEGADYVEGVDVAPGMVTEAVELLGGELLLTLSQGPVRWLFSTSVVGIYEGRVIVLLPPTLSQDSKPVALYTTPQNSIDADLLVTLPVSWGPYYALDVWDDGTGSPRRTAAPYPSAEGWVNYGPNEDGVSGSATRLMLLVGAPRFKLDFSIDLGTKFGECADSLLVQKIEGNFATPLALEGAACGRLESASVTVDQGYFSIGVISDRSGHSNDSGAGGPWEGWRLDAVTPLAE